MTSEDRGELTRREFLSAAGKVAIVGAAAQSGWLEACGASTKGPSAAAWQALSSKIGGRLLRPGQSGYDDAAQPYNRRYAVLRPEGIARCQSADDVRQSILWARENGVPFRVMSGSHSYAGYSATQHLSIDMSGLNSISADAATGIITLEVGARNHQIFDALPPINMGLPHGRCPNTGVGGFVLGGGFGFTSRSMGTLCDNLVETQVVTASGEILTANAQENSDLYWACRGGGGGNFGVNVYYKLQARPIPSTQCVYSMTWPWDQARDAIHLMQQTVLSAPDSFGCRIGLGGAPSGSETQFSVDTIGTYLGPLDELKQILQPVMSATNPSSPVVESVTNAQALQFLAADVPWSRFAAKSSYAAEPYSDAALTALLGTISKWPGSSNPGGSGAAIFCFGGAVAQVAPDATAYVHRSGTFLSAFEATWTRHDSPGVVNANLSWLNDVYEAMQPYVLPESYQNWPDPTLANWQHAYYGSNLPRLVQVKRMYDPDNLFHFPQSIPPVLRRGTV